MVLLLSHRETEGRALIQQAAVQAGVPTNVLQGYRAPGNLNAEELHIYAEPLFADVIASQLDLALLEAPLDWLTRVPAHLLGRDVELTTMNNVRNMSFPRFVKALDDKRISPKVYAHQGDIANYIEDETVVLTCQPVQWQNEMRLFLLDGQILAGSLYMLNGLPHVETLDGQQALGLRQQAQLFVNEVYDAVADTLPSATVLDVGQDAKGNFTIVEANAAWASGLYASDPLKALPAILASTCSRHQASQLPAQFVRETAVVDFS